MTDARRQSANGRQASRQLQIAFYFPYRFEVMKRQQRAQGLLGIDGPIVVNEIKRDLDVPARLGGDLLLHQNHAGVK